MNCREFDDLWNEWLDARSPGRPAMDPGLEAHSSACDRCRKIAAGYQVLTQAMASWPAIPAPSAGSLDRLYALKVPPARTRRRARLVYWAPLATAAAVFGMVWLGEPARTPDLPPTSAPPSRVATPRPLGAALAEATEATIDLAREASAPATRIGREVIEYEEAALSDPSKPGAAEEVASTASELLQTVGEQVNAGVRPISGSARHAFSFLLGPATEHTHAAHAATRSHL